MDIRGALLERVLQKPVDDVDHMAVIDANFATLAQLDELLEVEQAATVLVVHLGVIGALDRSLHAPPFGQVTVHIERIGNDANNLAPGEVRDIVQPAHIERFRRGDGHAVFIDRHRQDPIALRVGVTDDLSDGRYVDPGRINTQIRQLGAISQPLRKYFQAQRLDRHALVGDFQVGNQDQRMQLHASARIACVVASLGDVFLADQTIAGQRFERGVEVQAPKRAKSEFVFAGRRTGLVRLRQRWLEQFASHRIVILAVTIKRSRHDDTRRTPSASPISCPLY